MGEGVQGEEVVEGGGMKEVAEGEIEEENTVTQSQSMCVQFVQ